jgi:hypothetical protein
MGMRWLGTRPWERAAMHAATPILLALVPTFLIASFGMDAVNVVKPGDLVAFQTFENTVVRPTQQPAVLAQLGPGNLPGILAAKSARQTEIDRLVVGDDMNETTDLDPTAEVVRFTAKYLTWTGQTPQDANLWAVWSPLSQEYARAYATERPATFAGLRDAFLASPYWTVVLSDRGTILFRFNGAAYPTGSSSVGTGAGR